MDPLTHPDITSKIERPTWVEIDTAAIKANIGALRKNVAASTHFMAVVKAEGYGHGAVGVALAAIEAGADHLGVATPFEGQLLRAAGIELPILVLSPVLAHQAASIAKYTLTPSVTSMEAAEAMASAGVRVHVKVNTGMNRSGIDVADTVEFLRVARAKNIDVEGVFSHLAGADDADRNAAYNQFEVFEGLLRELRAVGLRPRLAHIANSAAIIDMPEMALDLVRAGIAMYGLYPSEFVSRHVKLSPALSWKSRVVESRRVKAGTPVSYNSTFIARSDTTLALMPVGYADGYRRALSNRGEVLICGRRFKVAGRVCMDLTVIDCGDNEGNQIRPGEEIVLIGRQGDPDDPVHDEITADEMAQWLATNNYEVTTQISYRVPRHILQS